jgi:hypothetical protein
MSQNLTAYLVKIVHMEVEKFNTRFTKPHGTKQYISELLAKNQNRPAEK